MIQHKSKEEVLVEVVVEEEEGTHFFDKFAIKSRKKGSKSSYSRQSKKLKPYRNSV